MHQSSTSGINIITIIVVALWQMPTYSTCMHN